VTGPPELPIVYIDEHLVAVNKPAGLLVHRTGLERNDRFFALQLLRDRLGERLYPLHRLDRPTSGLLLFARHRDAASRMGEQFRSGRVEKRYLALVRGWPDRSGVIDHPVPSTRGHAVGREAQTAYRRLASAELPVAVCRYPTSRYALVEVIPGQGRRHQIRYHFKHIFHPIIGDVNYGDGRHNRLFRDRYGLQRLMLAAVDVSFRHPLNGLRVTIQAPPDESFASIARGIEWDRPSVEVPDDLRGCLRNIFCVD